MLRLDVDGLASLSRGRSPVESEARLLPRRSGRGSLAPRRIAVLSPWHPEPADNGSKLRARAVIGALAEEFDVVLISLLPPETIQHAELPAVPGVWQQFTLPLPGYNPRSPRALIATLSSFPRSMVMTWSEDTARAIRAILETCGVDLALAADLRVVRYVCALDPGMPVIVDEANMSPFVSPPGKRRSLRRWLREHKYRVLLEGLERRTGMAIVASEQEASAYRLLTGSNRISVIEHGMTSLPTEKWQPPHTSKLLYTGSLTYSANAEAVDYFVQSIMPRIEQHIPNMSLTVTGEIPARLPDAARHPHVTLTGRLPSLDSVFRESRVFVAPLLSGMGTRIKILEALSYGIPVVSTTKGAEGLPVAHGEHLFLADDPSEFSDAVVRLMRDPQLSCRLGATGRALIEERFTWESRGDSLRTLVRDLMEQASQGASHVGRPR
jgi:polysaccharide biosynthesis protein PslH